MTKCVVRGLGLTILLLALAAGARAELVTELYSAEVPVADQSSSALARASALALSEVLVKVSGSAAVLRNPVIAAALGDARNRVQQFSYRRDPSPEGDGLLLRVEFDSTYVSGLMIEAGAPIWTANRPPVLVWLVSEAAAGRHFVNPDIAAEMTAALRAEFSRRGVPLQLPLYDLADAAALTPEQAGRLDSPLIAAASGRYNLQDVLAGRFEVLPAGGVAGEWAYLFGSDRIARSVTAASEQEFFRQGAELVAEAMAARYAVAPTAGDSAGEVMMVAGVTSYADYAAVVSWLEGLELIEQANVESIQGDVIKLRLLAQADPSRLAAIIELNQRLVPVPVMPGSPAPQLNYQWQK